MPVVSACDAGLEHLGALQLFHTLHIVADGCTVSLHEANTVTAREQNRPAAAINYLILDMCQFCCVRPLGAGAYCASYQAVGVSTRVMARINRTFIDITADDGSSSRGRLRSGIEDGGFAFSLATLVAFVTVVSICPYSRDMGLLPQH